MKKLKGVGLALSGGGFRASLFHLGVTRRLHELGILQQVTRLSTVSGGSIFAGFLANVLIEENRSMLEFDDWNEEISKPFRKFVRKDIRTGLFMRHVGWNWLASGPRAKGYERVFAKRLTGRNLVELPDKKDGVEFIFLATDMKYGVSWKFTQDNVGQYVSGHWSTPETMPIAKAVAASACFPPIFGPIPIKSIGRETAYLTDGGVYDNTGMEPIWDENKIVLISDSGAPFKSAVPKWYGSRLLRYSEIGRNQVGAQRRRALVRRLDSDYRTIRVFPPNHKTLTDVSNPCGNANQSGCFTDDKRLTDKPTGSYWRIESKKKNFKVGASDEFKSELADLEKNWYGYSDDVKTDIVPKHIATIRTDLDSFTTEESGILENHGYYMADIAVRRHARAVGDFSASFKVPNPDLIDEDLVRKALKNSSSLLAFWKRWLNKA